MTPRFQNIFLVRPSAVAVWVVMIGCGLFALLGLIAPRVDSGHTFKPPTIQTELDKALARATFEGVIRHDNFASAAVLMFTNSPLIGVPYLNTKSISSTNLQVSGSIESPHVQLHASPEQIAQLALDLGIKHTSGQVRP